MPNTQKNKTLMTIVAVGLMSALVYVGNYLSIPLPDETRIHLGNSMCLLAGLLFGGVKGGLASGIGAAFYDLFNPLYITSAPYTFFSKFAMGFTAGIIRTRGKNEKAAVTIGAITGQAVYIILYLGKKFVSELLLGEPVNVAIASIGLKAPASVINGIAACVIAIPLYFALSKALQKTGFSHFLGRTPKENTAE